MSNDVTFARKDYTDAKVDWELVEDVCAGQRRVKKGMEKYLPLINSQDKSFEAKARYETYLERAVFYAICARTLEGLIGAVYRKEPMIEVPAALEYIKTNIDGKGLSIAQQAKDVLEADLQKGRHGLFVDYPTSDKPATVSDRQSGQFNATVKSVNAGSVVNWQTMTSGSETKLSLVVMSEVVENITEDGFGIEEEEQYRALRLIDGVYVVQVWKKEKDKNAYYIDQEYTPLDGAGQTWNEIPFIFVGAQNNDPAIDKSPLLDLANLNIAHYRNSADYEDSVFFVGQVQPYITELDEEWRDFLQEHGIVIGSRSPILLPKGSTFGYAQAKENMVAFEAMKHKEELAKQMGARLLEKGLAAKTATESNSDSASEHSVLSLVVSNVTDAYNKCLEWMARYMNTSEPFTFKLNTDFVQLNIDPQILTALVGAWQTGKLLSKHDVWAYLKKVGVIDSEKSEDEIEEELESDPTGLGLEDDELAEAA